MSAVVQKHCCQTLRYVRRQRVLFPFNHFEASRPLAATTNTGVVTRAVDAGGHESKYYGVIKNIIEYMFAGNKNLKAVLFDFDWFDPYHGTRENNFGMVEVKHARRLHGCDPFILAHQVEQVYYMLYPCEKLSA
jgi:hypothetical protein